MINIGGDEQSKLYYKCLASEPHSRTIVHVDTIKSLDNNIIIEDIAAKLNDGKNLVFT